MYRKTYSVINIKAIKENVFIIINKYPEYKYYFGVVKANAYGFSSKLVVNAIIESGVNYLAVSSLEEALTIRKFNKIIPILCLEPINDNGITMAIKNNITLTISSLDYVNKIIKYHLTGLKVHLKIDSGMNRLGIKNNLDFIYVYNLLKVYNINIEGVYTHLYKGNNCEIVKKQIDLFKMIINNNQLNIPIVHIFNSEGLVYNKKIPLANGIRLGLIMYGFSNKLKLFSTYSLYSEVIEIKKVLKGEVVGYNGNYIASEDIKVGIVPIGYADGIIRNNTGRHIFINNSKYFIIGNICMDMLMVKIDDNVKVGDKVDILKDNEDIIRVAKYLKTIPYEVLCLINNRVTKKYIK